MRSIVVHAGATLTSMTMSYGCQHGNTRALSRADVYRDRGQSGLRVTYPWGSGRSRVRRVNGNTGPSVPAPRGRSGAGVAPTCEVPYAFSYGPVGVFLVGASALALQRLGVLPVARHPHALHPRVTVLGRPLGWRRVLRVLRAAEGRAVRSITVQIAIYCFTTGARKTNRSRTVLGGCATD